MSDDKLHRHEIAPGCWIVSSEGTSRSGDAMADTVRAICEGADRRSARAPTYAEARAACVARWGDAAPRSSPRRCVWDFDHRVAVELCGGGASAYLYAERRGRAGDVVDFARWLLAGDGDVAPLPDALDAADAFLRTHATTATKGP